MDTVNGWSTGRDENFCEKRNEKNENYILSVVFAILGEKWSDFVKIDDKIEMFDGLCQVRRRVVFVFLGDFFKELQSKEEV